MQTTLKGAPRIMSIVRNRNGHRYFLHFLLICAALIYGSRPAFAQTTGPGREQTQEEQPVSGISQSSDPASENPGAPSKQAVVCGPAHLGRCLKDIALDQAGIWTSPLRLQSRDALWLVPFAGATAVAIHYDARAQQELGIIRAELIPATTSRCLVLAMQRLQKAALSTSLAD